MLQVLHVISTGQDEWQKDSVGYPEQNKDKSINMVSTLLIAMSNKTKQNHHQQQKLDNINQKLRNLYFIQF